MTTPRSEKQVRFSNKSQMRLVKNLSQSKEQASKLWYSQEEIDQFKWRFSLSVQQIRSQLRQNSDLLDKGCVTINVAALLGLEKHLSSELTAEFMKRRVDLRRAVLAEHRQHSAMLIPRATARLATVSAQHSRWARERASTAAALLEQDVLQDMKDMNLRLQVTTPRPLRCSMPRINEARAAGEGHLPSCQRRWEADATGGGHHRQRRWSSSSWSWGSTRNMV